MQRLPSGSFSGLVSTAPECISSRSPMAKARLIAALAALLALTAVIYAPNLHGELQFDDHRTVESDPAIRDLNALTRGGPLLGILAGRLLTQLTFALDYRVSGTDPFAFHLTDLGIHLGVTLLVFFFTRKMLALAGGASGAAADAAALAVSALFALHPIQTQAVAYISQRSESMASGLYLGSLLCLLAAEQARGWRRGTALYLGSLLLFVLGIATKLIVLTLPVAYWLLPLLAEPGERERLARPAKRLLFTVPFGILVVLVSGKVLSLFGGPGLVAAPDAGFSVPSLPPQRFFITQWHVIVTYLRLLVFPVGQNVDWDFPLARGFGDPVVLACGLFLLLLLLAAVVLVLRCRRRSDRAGAAGRAAGFGVLWFFLLLAPTSTLVPLADVLMEHRLYLASWGILFALAAGASMVAERLPRRVWLGAALVLCAALATATYSRASLWRTKLLLWSDAVAKSPQKARTHLGLGNALRVVGRLDPAIDEYKIALSLAAREPAWQRASISDKLAIALLAQGRAEEAIAAAQTGLAEQPAHTSLLATLAMAYLRRGDFAQAEEAADRSLRSAAKPAASLALLGNIRMYKGDRVGGTQLFERAAKLEPHELEWKLYLAGAYRLQGRMEDACALLRAASEPTPEQQDRLRQAMEGCP